MNLVKKPEEIDLMQEGGKKLGEILQKLLDKATSGAALTEIELFAQQLIAQSGGTPSFQTVKNYKWATCLCVNDVVVHGIPTSYLLKDGDILTIDVGLFYKGFHTDTAWTKLIKSKTSQKQDESKETFLKVGEEALWKAIAQAKVGNRIGHITKEIQNTLEGAGYGVVRTLVGHGVGRELHEAPQVPGILKEPIEETLPLTEGMTLAIEVIYAMGGGTVVYTNDDGWSIGTKDRSVSAVFEHTVAITDREPLVLTKAAA